MKAIRQQFDFSVTQAEIKKKSKAAVCANVNTLEKRGERINFNPKMIAEGNVCKN